MADGCCDGNRCECKYSSDYMLFVGYDRENKQESFEDSKETALNNGSIDSLFIGDSHGASFVFTNHIDAVNFLNSVMEESYFSSALVLKKKKD